jgi:hypothetical protein
MPTTIQIPIDLAVPKASALAGNSYWLPVALTAADKGFWHFLKDVQGKVWGKVRIPVNMAATPNAKIKLVICANATSGVTRIDVLHKAIQTKAPGESLNPASLVSIGAQDITVPATAYDAKEISFTVSEALAAEDELDVEIFHVGDHANDTLAVTTLLYDAFLEIDVG